MVPAAQMFSLIQAAKVEKVGASGFDWVRERDKTRLKQGLRPESRGVRFRRLSLPAVSCKVL